jgi:hypothetical protein
VTGVAGATITFQEGEKEVSPPDQMSERTRPPVLLDTKRYGRPRRVTPTADVAELRELRGEEEP